MPHKKAPEIQERRWREDNFNFHWKPQPHENKLYVHKQQNDRHVILARNAELRKNPGVLTDLSFGRYALSIPLEDYEVLKQKYPILVNGSNAERAAFYKKWLRSSESIPYRVQG